MSDFAKIAQFRTLAREYHETQVTRSDVDTFTKLAPLTLNESRDNFLKKLHSIKPDHLIIPVQAEITLANGDASNLNVMLHYYMDNLQAKDITRHAAWTSSNAAVATVNSGVVTTVGVGETLIKAELNGMVSNSIKVTVV